MDATVHGMGAIRKWFLHVEQFHRGQFLFGKKLEEIAFSREDAFGETNEGGSGEDDIDMEDGSGKYGLNTEGSGRDGSFDTEGNG